MIIEYRKGGKIYRPDKMTTKQKSDLQKKDLELYTLMFGKQDVEE